MIGRVTFQVGSREYTLRLTTMALCNIEADLGQTIGQVFSGFEKGISLTALRSIMRNGIEGERLTIEHVSGMIDDLGMAEAAKIVTDAISAAFPDGEDKGGGAGAKPGKKKAAE